MWQLTENEGATNGGMGKHIDTLGTAELVVFGKVCRQCVARLNVAVPDTIGPGYFLDPIPLYIRRVTYQNLDFAILPKCLCNPKIPLSYQRPGRCRASMDNHLFLCFCVPSLADLAQLVSGRTGYNDK